ncbi:MAG: hypothetical protein GQ578_05340 [Desulfuromonadaceae bacterium]|nr:hypothetical protein [Desulfuromonadaceae bacterium]
MKVEMKGYSRLVMAIAFLFLGGGTANAGIQGNCVNCHTMHNSQDGASMQFDSSAAPNSALLRTSCLGCHAQGGAQALVSLGDDIVPQVMHSESIDLSAGNFAFITGMKGSGAADSKGHNIIELTGIDNTISALPGGIKQTYHEDMIVNTSNLTCAGTNGCHGYRYASSDLPEGISGAHHANGNGKLDVADAPANSYRFLTGVKGLEDSDWQYTRAGADHNEYFAVTQPIQLGCSTTHCHGSNGVEPPDGTISQFCATCHGNFHTLGGSTSDGIGPVVSSPFLRHPTDIILPSSGEYAQYTNYSLAAPIGRTGTLPENANSVVTPGSDAVICLSCHASHASDYPDMLRWDYVNDCTAGVANPNCGCFTCHTSKD